MHLLAPFDPVVWDRRRFELLWGWPYRFEAYTPAAKRTLGYYALPMLWRDAIVGWANVAVKGSELDATFGYVAVPPAARSRVQARAGGRDGTDAGVSSAAGERNRLRGCDGGASAARGGVVTPISTTIRFLP